MSTLRVVLVSLQAVCHHLALTPPRPTPPKGRYHTEQMYILQIAPMVFKCHQLLAHLTALLEITNYALLKIPPFFLPTLPTSLYAYLSSSSQLLPIHIPIPTSLIQPTSQCTCTSTPLLLIGILSVLLGTLIRKDCFTTLGDLFTYDLTIHPAHRLITSRLYSYVRHPAYTGSMLLVIGLTLTTFTQGSLVRCFLGGTASAVIWLVWWIWTFSVGVSRAEAEDRAMKGLFGQEWEEYAARVRWWFFPGLV